MNYLEQIIIEKRKKLKTYNLHKLIKKIRKTSKQSLKDYFLIAKNYYIAKKECKNSIKTYKNWE